MTADRERLRRRVLAFSGVWFLVAGLLTALSLVVVVLIASALMLLVAIAAGGLSVLRRYPIREASRSVLASVVRAGRSFGARLRELGIRRRLRRVGARARSAGTAAQGQARDLLARGGQAHARRLRRVGTRAGNVGTAAPGRNRVLLARAGQVYAIAVYRSLDVVAKTLRAGGRRVPALSVRTPAPPARECLALRLNERGAQLRREGDAEQAVEQHRVALEIVRDLGDQHAEALTLNNLGLALAQGGAETAAVQHLEQARTVLQELGDEEHEGQVLANLGLVHRRQGHREEAVTLLHEALDKLPPESSAYRQVEKQLSRAS